jgi:hypothetical protein
VASGVRASRLEVEGHRFEARCLDEEEDAVRVLSVSQSSVEPTR